MARWGEQGLPHVEPIVEQIRDVAFDIHRQVGSAFKESTYQTFFAHGLELFGVAFEQKVPVDAEYQGCRASRARELDFLVEDLVVVEIKAVEELHDVHRAQIVSYLRATGKPVGVLVNFSAPRMMDGWHRFVHPALLHRGPEVRRFGGSPAGGGAPEEGEKAPD